MDNLLVPPDAVEQMPEQRFARDTALAAVGIVVAVFAPPPTDRRLALERDIAVAEQLVLHSKVLVPPDRPCWDSRQGPTLPQMLSAARKPSHQNGHPDWSLPKDQSSGMLVLPRHSGSCRRSPASNSGKHRFRFRSPWRPPAILAISAIPLAAAVRGVPLRPPWHECRCRGACSSCTRQWPRGRHRLPWGRSFQRRRQWSVRNPSSAPA
mmetsp:Transcript_24591/g.52377  ORF Transcript_24591/g.52377 Transcript_24591/m.52377 type:complete len:209 (+) Transcript_24591:1184-1810(+)